ncbi:MAG TPA: hypothetical protein VH951_00145 [Dehalococcoidia bacterium]
MTTGEKLVVGGAALMLIASFLPWYSVSLGPLGSFHRSGWQSPGALWSVLALLISLGFAGIILGRKFGNLQLPDLGQFTWGQAALAAGAVVALCILLKLINESSSMAIGFFLGIIAAALVAVGGYFRYTEENAAGGVKRV